ncbi:MAG: ADP-ribosylglycohydrolase family protein [Deltaproteobacteria bacterium]|nr:ADP-ribosylglycohydrolase family protein [Deltaproteobacteria bacterium]
MSRKPLDDRVENPAAVDQVLGCLLGLALGDAYGAPFEGGPIERLVWRFIGTTSAGLPRWTDDTQMALDLAHVLLQHGRVDQDALARRFAHSYAWRRGYGPATARLLKRVRGGESWQRAATSVYPKGSFGNGAAMRAPVVALFVADEARLLAETRLAAQVTHGHPLGITGAELMAAATRLVLLRAPLGSVLDAITRLGTAAEYAARIEQARVWLRAGEGPEPAKVAQVLGNGMTAPTSVVTALYAGLRHLHAPFADLLAFVRCCGGDVDTLGAMAGALWGAHNGADGLLDLPVEGRDELERVARQIAGGRRLDLERN